jgi:hypothetical protein
MLRPISLLFAAFLFVFAACEEPHDEVYEEPITSLTFILTPDSGTTVVLQYLDRDGIGGQPAIINNGTLLPETNYECELKLNTLGKHLIDSTSIAQQPKLHQVFFLPQNGLQFTTEYADSDANGFPVGFKSQLTTGSASRGRLTLIINHHPDKQAEGVANGDLTNAGGSTDFEVSFDVAVNN